METFIHTDDTKQTKQERVEVISYLMLLVERRYGRVKSRNFIDG